MNSEVDAHAASVAVSSGLKQPYHLVEPSPWPLLGAAAGLFTVLGIVWWAHYGQKVLFVIGVVLILLDDDPVVARRAAREPRCRADTRRWRGFACATG